MSSPRSSSRPSTRPDTFRPSKEEYHDSKWLVDGRHRPLGLGERGLVSKLLGICQYTILASWFEDDWFRWVHHFLQPFPNEYAWYAMLAQQIGY